LTCGQELEVAANGVEAKLISFIDDKSRAVDDTSWFTFDRLEFETASATLLPGSQPQLRNIAAVMNCYPNVNIKVGGYTDNVGDPASNLKLSQARAENTAAAIVTHGIARNRLEAEGYGEQHPVASNDTAEGRQRNRRIDLRVTRK
jgi:outer membrane protein OmpA-like peptidoglycan-associated protein